MEKHHDVQDVGFEGDVLLLKLDGQVHRFDLSAVSPRLLDATEVERARFDFSPSGYGIHWPLLDEDLSIDGLLGIKHSHPVQKGRAA